MTTKYAGILAIVVFVLGLMIFGLGVKMLVTIPSQTIEKKDLTFSTDSTITESSEIDTLKNKSTNVKTSSTKNYKEAPQAQQGTCTDCIKSQYENAYKYITLGILVLFLLFLLPFLQEFNVLGLLSGKMRDKIDAIKSMNNQVQQDSAKPDIAGRPTLIAKKSGIETKQFTDAIKKEIETVGVISYPDDPQKNKWGGKNQRNDRLLTARITSGGGAKGIMELFDIELKVISTNVNKPLAGSVTFHLHPTFLNSEPVIFVKEGEAILRTKAWGAFTVGVEADNGGTRLELDLAELEDAPLVFRSR